jgi:signal transduction histidine kinase
VAAASGSLARRTLWRVAFRIGLVVAVATVVSFWHVRSGLEDQALNQLAQYSKERSARESAIFELASDNLLAFTEAYDTALRAADMAYVHASFETLFDPQADGTLRLGPDAFSESGITGFIGKYVLIDDDLRRRLVVAFDVMTQLGPAWRSRFVNLYVVLPENSLIMYWPDVPWTLDASDWEIYSKLALAARHREGEVVVMDRFVAGIAGMQRWSDLYFDYGVNDWMVSAMEPVNRDGLHLISVGHDILLRDLIERTLTSEVDDTYNVLFRRDGRLIAHPRYMDAIQAQGGTLAIQEAGDQELMRIHAIATADGSDGRIIENAEDDAYLAVSRLAGPDWYLVTVFPRSIVTAQAFETAQLVLILGAVALLIEILVLYLIMRRQIAEPLKGLVRATREVASGRYNAKLDTGRDDEIGQLARSFTSMAAEIEARQTELNERSAKLAEVNVQLEGELKEREKAELEIARQRDALYQSEKLNALGSLLAGVAHELNNPLSVVVGRSMMLEERFKDTLDESRVNKLRAAAERCAKIVKTFLALARQETPARQATRIDDVLDGALEIVGYGLRTDSIELERAIDDGLPEISADPNQLVQVVTNLLVNAQHALRSIDGPRRIRVSATLDGASGMLVVSVADNGPGISGENLSRIFEPFFTTKPVGKGTGLGLSVCRGLIEAHGGMINARRRAEGGTEFEIRLPVRQVEPAAEAEADEPTPEVKPQHILVVEDEPDVAQMLAEVLGILGHETTIADTGKTALDRLADRRFDLILSDMRMPDMDGRALFEAIKERYPELTAKVIFVTGDSLSGPTARFLEEAGRPVIEKPFTPGDVKKVVGEQITSSSAG